MVTPRYDRIAFGTRRSDLEDYQVLTIHVNGVDLVDWLRRVEAPLAARDGTPYLAGAYEGIPPLCALPPARHFWGEALPAYTHGDRVSLLEYAYSGVPDEWTFLAKIDVAPETVRWHRFGQLRRDGSSAAHPYWDYTPLGVLTFRRADYATALRAASDSAY